MRAEVERVLVSELAVVPRNAGDELEHLASAVAAAMDEIELSTNESAPSVGRVGGDQFRPVDDEGSACVRPSLGDREDRRHDPSGRRVLDHGGVVEAKRRVRVIEEVARPTP